MLLSLLKRRPRLRCWQREPPYPKEKEKKGKNEKRRLEARQTNKKAHTDLYVNAAKKKKEKDEENKAVLLQNRGKEKAGIAAILLQNKRQTKKNIDR